jgi:LPS-assembly protein
MNKPVKRIIIYICIFLSIGVAFADEIEIFADNLEYVESRNKIDAKGNVVLNFHRKKIYADYLEFVINEKVINAYGNVKIEEDGNTIRANSISYNYENETGNIKETFTYSSHVFMRSKSMEIHGKNTFAMHDIIFSNCDLDKPHTYFKSKHCKLILNKRITIYNTVFYIGKVPVFYLPFVTKSLRPNKIFGSNLKFEIEPAYVKNSGVSLKTAISFSLSKISTCKIKYDLLGKKSKSYGTKINYTTDNAVGNIFVYATKDLTDNNKKKFDIRHNYFHKVNDQWTIRSRLNFINNGDPTNLYNKNKNRFEEIHNEAIVTRQCSKANLLFGGLYNNNTVSDCKTSIISFPRVILDVYAKNLSIGVVQKPYLQYSHDYTKAKESNSYFYKNTILLKYALTKNFKFGRKLVLKPNLEAIGNWYDRDNSGSFKNARFIQYGGYVNARFRATSWMDCNIIYLYRANSWHDGSRIESSCFKLNNYMYIDDKITVRNVFEYSLLPNNSLSGITNQCKRPFIITELMWTPKYFINVYAEEVQLMNPCKFNSLKFYAKLGYPQKVYIKFGAFYQNCSEAKNRKISNVLRFIVWLTPKWRFDYNVKATIPVDLSYMSVNNQEFRLYRDLHCYNFFITWRKTKYDSGNIFLKLSLKRNMPFKDANNLSCNIDEK